MPGAPLAALAWLGETGAPPTGQVLFATPVHLQAGMHDLVLFAGPALQVTPTERAQLAADIAAFFGDTPAIRPAGKEMFLLPGNALDLHTRPLHEVQGETVRDRLPRGADARRAHTWMNELQMFLHDHAINRARAVAGQPVLNGLWLWGEGPLPARVDANGVVVFARTSVMRGLGRLIGEARDVTIMEEMLPDGGHRVIEITTCIDALDADDEAAWQHAVDDVATNVLQPVLAWLAATPGARCALYAGDGKVRELRGGSTAWRRWFRRAPPLRIGEEG